MGVGSGQLELVYDGNGHAERGRIKVGTWWNVGRIEVRFLNADHFEVQSSAAPVPLGRRMCGMADSKSLAIRAEGALPSQGMPGGMKVAAEYVASRPRNTPQLGECRFQCRQMTDR